MAEKTDPFDQVLGVIERYLSGTLSFDAAAGALDPLLRVFAKQQQQVWQALERRPGAPITIKKPSVEDWKNPNTGRGQPLVFNPVSFAPGRSREDEGKGRALFEEACRRTFGTDAA
jgi:hypothetical protein